MTPFTRWGGPRVWALDLDGLGPELVAIAEPHGVSSPQELDWLPQSTPDASRSRRLTARTAVRLLLNAAGAPSAFGIDLPVDANGKPVQQPGWPAFNVSHSGGHALIVMSPRGPVGIDLERHRDVHISGPRRALFLAAGEALSSELTHGFAKTSDDARFLSSWTRLEAVAKARGCGIGKLLTDVGITAAGVRTLSAEAVAGMARDVLSRSGLCVRTLSMEDGLYGAISAPIGEVPARIIVEQIGIGLLHECLRTILSDAS